MNLRTIFFSLLFLFPIYISAGVTGTYKVSGFDPSTNHNYTATLVIEKDGAVFTAHWTFPDGSFDTGTGVKKGDALSFVFHEDPAGDFGVQQYEIDDDRLKGPWVRFGSTQKGFEKAKKIDSSTSISGSCSGS